MIGIVIQARMGSSRLPGKILMRIGQKTLLEHIFFRLAFLKHQAQIVLATSSSEKDNIVEDFCRLNGIPCFRGSEFNVLERYYFCAKRYQFHHIIRLTADNPFTDIEELDCLIDLYLQEKADYSHSFHVLPVGTGAEIFFFKALEDSFRKGKEPHHLEHVNEYILEHPQEFRIAALEEVPSKKRRPDIRLTIDTKEDYLQACYIVEHSEQEYITTEEAIRLCLEYA
jgi:spore coat polysaccharide biosynthesis protein SpsF